ncbi:hypothetical protein DSO57_1018998 [Entomophthora muscae]|uniref:Uncharacterized protein n=1 Tax=Entomophthora muscae TaxID=34485 RepID=A0ACC2RIT3_9FUNG|nr:hypothetical protein DSO57_1018998 [Entomophthora muscae]
MVPLKFMVSFSPLLSQLGKVYNSTQASMLGRLNLMFDSAEYSDLMVRFSACAIILKAGASLPYQV